MRFDRHVCIPAGFLLFALLGVTPVPASGATLTVCGSGCAYADFQQAIDAAQPGDTILLRGGETYTGHFVLPAKHNPSGIPIVIRSSAPGVSLPAPGVRLVPDGYPGTNVHRSALARLVGRGGQWKTTPVLITDPGAHHYRIELLDIDGISQEGFYTLVEIGTNDARRQSTLDSVPFDIVLDRVFIHGHPTKGQQRCLGLNGRNVQILNSHIVDCSSFALDAQAVAAYNGPGPLKIINNYLEATGENVMFGGADPSIHGLVPSDIEIRRNHFTKPVAWRSPILEAPAGAPSAAAGSNGWLGGGTYYFTVVAVLESGGDLAFSAPSPERGLSVPAGGAVTLSWNRVAGADRYRVYAGNSSGGQDRYMETSGAQTSLSYTGAGEHWGRPPSHGTRWAVKNLLEFKNAQRVTVDGNVFEHLWPGSQSGYAILLTPRNDGGTAPWSVVQDIAITNNIIRHISGGLNILGSDDIQPSQRTARITIANNLVYDLSGAWGGSSHFVVMTRSPEDVTFDHNTIFMEGMLLLVDDGVSYGLRFTNNVSPHNEYGLFGSSIGTGSAALSAYFPDAEFSRNALGGGPATSYPADNLFPDLATFRSQFVDIGASDFRLVAGSLFAGRGTDGRDLGVDYSALSAAVEGVVVGEQTVPGGTTGETGGGSTGGENGGGASSPYASSVTLPGLFQAENFDNGGVGVAYDDTSAGNAGGQYRTTDVDVESTSDTGSGHNVGWLAAGEWLKYTVEVTAAGTYALEFRVASAGTGGTFHVEVNGADVTGPVSIPNTGGWQAWTTVTKSGVALNAGPQVWTVVFDSATNGVVGNLNYIRAVASGGSGSGSAPYTGIPAALPGTVQAENFDQGGNGEAYRDTTGGNSGGALRSTDVDIEATSDAGGGYNVGWLSAGEWLRYSVTLAAAGTYDVEFRVASAGTGGSFHLEVNGADATGPISIPNTGGWQAWTTVTRSGVQLPAGAQVWRLVIDTETSGIVGNLNYIRLGGAAGGGGGSPAYGGTPQPIPGLLELESFDSGPSGTAYGDTTGGNSGGAYRATDVDIEGASDDGGGYSVGWVGAGEWLQYTVNVSATGIYDLEFRVASPGAGGTFHMEVNGADVTGALSVPSTGGWQSWATVRRTGVSLAAGQQVWRLVFDTNGSSAAVGNFNYVRVLPGGGGTGTEPRDIVLYASDVTAMAGNFLRVGSWSGAGGEKMQSTDYGWGATDRALSSPPNYFEAQFVPEAGRAYRVWIRLRASGESTNNDSVWLQFSGAVNASGAALWPVGSQSGLLVDLEQCYGCGVSLWGWAGASWWTGDSAVAWFTTSTPQTIRVQIREDGVEVDQIVLSPVTYFDRAPGASLNDTTIVPKR